MLIAGRAIILALALFYSVVVADSLVKKDMTITSAIIFAFCWACFFCVTNT